MIARFPTAIRRSAGPLRLAAVVPLVAATGMRALPVSAAEPGFVGTWSADARTCAAPQSSDRAPIVITAKGYDQYETHCLFGPLSGGGKSWTTDAKCSVQGETQKILISMTTEGRTLKLKQGPGRAVKLQRCG